MKAAIELALIAVVVLACARTAVPDKHVEEAVRLQKAGELAKEVEVLDKAAKEHPNRAKVHAYLGLYLGMEAGQTHDFSAAGEFVRSAFAHLDQAVALDSSDSDARFFRGMLSVRVPDFFGKLEAGVRDLEFVLKHPGKRTKSDMDDRMVTTWSLLGTGYQKQNQLDKAIADFSAVIQLDPGNFSAYLQRGLAHDQKHNRDAALIDLRKALTLAPTSGDKAAVQAELDRMK